MYLHLILTIIIPGQFIKRRKWCFGPPHQGRFDILTMISRKCSRLDPSYSATLHLHVHAATNCTPITVQSLLSPTHQLAVITPWPNISSDDIDTSTTLRSGQPPVPPGPCYGPAYITQTVSGVHRLSLFRNLLATV